MGLTLYDLNDRELLYRLQDVADDSGGATSTDIANALGLKGVEARNVSIRLSWLKRYGAVDTRDGQRRNEEEKLVKAKLWFLTSDGEKYVNAHLNQRQRASLEKTLDGGAMLEATMLMTERYQVLASSTGGQLIRRQWKSVTDKPRRPYNPKMP